MRLRDKLARTNFVNFTKSRTLGYLEPFFSSVTVGAMHFHITSRSNGGIMGFLCVSMQGKNIHNPQLL